jgi:hypothetical protein
MMRLPGAIAKIICRIQSLAAAALGGDRGLEANTGRGGT